VAPARAKQLELAGRIPPYPMQVIGDPGRLRQILVNLIANAVKFTEQGRVHVSMETLRQKNETITVKVTVADTGIGIGKNQQMRLFQSFVQADDSMSRKYGGTGLGLAISKQLVEMLGGDIGVESELGKGSKFWFTAVFRQAPPSEVAEFAPRTESSALPTPAKNGKAALPLPFGGEQQCRRVQRAPVRLLLAEDNPMNQKLTKAMLEKASFQVDIANNGLEAVAAFRRQHYDAILMDCQMPELDGYDATREIRQLELPGQHIPIIAVTAHAMTGDREKCMEAGMDDYLTKPTNLTDLRRIVTQWLEWSSEKLGQPAATPVEARD
jgi:CheY-like chemotaxis protein